MPFGRIRDAITRATTDTIVALARGRYDEVVVIDRDVTLWGACPAETVLSFAIASTFDPIVRATSGTAVLRNLTVGDGPRSGVSVDAAAASVHLEDVIVAQVEGFGLRSQRGGRLETRNVLVRDCQAPGLTTSSATAELSRTEIRNAAWQGADTDGATGTIHMTDVLIRDTGPAPDLGGGTGIAVTEGASVQLERCVLRSNRSFGAVATGAGSRIETTDVRIDDTQVQELDRRNGVGVAAVEGASAMVSRVVVTASAGAGLFAQDPGTTAVFEDVVVDDSLSGVNVQVGAAAEVRRARVRGHTTVGLGVFGMGVTATAEDLTVQDPVESMEGSGVGIQVTTGAALELRRSRIVANRLAGFVVNASSAVVEDVLIRDTQPDASGANGIGIRCTGVGSTELTRVLVQGAHTVGVFVGAGASVVARDFVSRDTLPRAMDGTAGLGLAVETASADVTRGLFAGNSLVGVGVTDDEAVLFLTDVEIVDTHPGVDVDGASVGIGLAIQEGAAQATIRRTVVDGSVTVGVYVDSPGARADLEDVEVRDTRSSESDGQFGYGLQVSGSAAVTGRRVTLAGNRGLGAGAYRAATLDLEDAHITGTLAMECGTTTCASMGGGTALGVYGASAQLMGFELDGAALCGAQIAEDGNLDLSSGSVSNNTIGACVQVEGYDLSRLMSEVRYQDNGVNLDSTDLPVPDAASP